MVSLLLILAMFVMQAMGFEGGAYLGILTFVVLPMLFLLGLALIPIGLWWRKRKDAKLAAQGKDVGHLPVIDLNDESTRGVILTFVALAVPVLALAAGLTFKAVHYMDSTEFCGLACHKVMQPEFTAFKRSPHVQRRVRRLPHRSGRRMVRQGQDLWLVAARRRGIRPLPAPDPDPGALAASGERHLRAVPLAGSLRRRAPEGPHAFADDEQNTEQMTALMVRIGGRQGGTSHGIHWHVDPNHTVRYLGDRSREKIYEIELTDKTAGTKKVFKPDEAGAEGLAVADDGLRGLPQPAVAQLSHAGVRGGPCDHRGADRPQPAVCQARGRAHPDREGIPVARGGPRRHLSRIEHFYATNYPAARRSRRPSNRPARRSATLTAGTTSRT